MTRIRTAKHVAAKAEATRSDLVLALCEYWLAAEFMRRQTHAIKDKWARARTRHWSEFRTYHSYWLSALYVVELDWAERLHAQLRAFLVHYVGVPLRPSRRTRLR